jgi:hypothetical protein
LKNPRNQALLPLFASGEDSMGALGPAARALGILDVASLPLLQRYALCLDDEHEHYFAGNIVPDLVRKHGWADRRIVEFVIWFMRFDFYNVIKSYGEVWRGWGMGDALRGTVPPKELALIIASAVEQHSPCFGQPSDRADMIGKLYEDLQPHGTFEIQLFAALGDLKIV